MKALEKRQYCHQCKRPIKMCICGVIQSIHSSIQVAILQHPLEQKQAKGTALLAHLCLPNSRLNVAETLSYDALCQWLDLQSLENVFLLYPQTENFEGKVVNASPQLVLQAPDITLLVLDGTWRKTMKMLAINPVLQTLPRIQLTDLPVSNYSIRKQKSESSLATIEAIAAALNHLEPNNLEVNRLHEVFSAFQAKLSQFMPPHQESKN